MMKYNYDDLRARLSDGVSETPLLGGVAASFANNEQRGNTWTDSPAIEVSFRGTRIARYTSDGAIALYMEGWPTRHMASLINGLIEPVARVVPYRPLDSHYDYWALQVADGQFSVFYDGITLDRDNHLRAKMDKDDVLWLINRNGDIESEIEVYCNRLENQWFNPADLAYALDTALDMAIVTPLSVEERVASAVEFDPDLLLAALRYDNPRLWRAEAQRMIDADDAHYAANAMRAFLRWLLPVGHVILRREHMRRPLDETDVMILES